MDGVSWSLFRFARRVGVAALLLATVFGAGRLHGWTLRRLYGAVRVRHGARPQETGTDGSSTGTAKFLGNFTAINDPTSNFLLQRQTDCSLNFITATGVESGSTVHFTITGNTPHYEQTLHTLAGLKTMAGTYPHGCAESNLGISTRPGVYNGVPRGVEGVSTQIVGDGVRTRIYTNGYTSVTENTETSLPSASGVMTADLDGDGNPDLVVVNANGPTSAFVSIMMGNADGTFKTPVNYATAGNYSVAAVVDDVNGDGKLDLVVASDDQHISVLTGKGDGTFNTAQSFSAALNGNTSSYETPILQLITADVNGDGKKDLICSNGLVLLGNGDGSFSQLANVAFPYLQGTAAAGLLGIATGDLNGDGKLDVVTNDGSTIQTWLGKGDGTFSPGAGYTTASNYGFVTVTDLDGDGNLDIYSGMANGGCYSGDPYSASAAYVLMGNGDGTFQGAPALSGSYVGTNLGDVNGDGIPDLVTENTSGSAGTGIVLTVQLGTGKGGFHAVSTITLPSSFVVGSTTVTTAGAGINSFAVGDLNGDGKADIALTVSGLGGFNGIGMPVQYSGSPIYFTVLSNGDGTFSAPVPHLLQIAPGGSNGYDNQGSIDGIKIADFNHDGHADLIVTYVDVFGSFSGTVASPFNQGFDVLLGNGDGTFQAGVTTTTYTGATAATVAFPAEVGAIQDLNGDGFSDLLVVNPTFSTTAGPGSQVEVFLGRGDGSFKAPAPVTTANNTVVPVFPGSPTAGLVVADFNKDGRVDLACLGESTSGQGQLAISLGNGDGTFAAPTLLNVPGGDTVRHSSLAAADFDGDGSVDLALFNAI